MIRHVMPCDAGRMALPAGTEPPRSPRRCQSWCRVRKPSGSAVGCTAGRVRRVSAGYSDRVMPGR
jgi:hypothetical protein